MSIIMVDCEDCYDRAKRFEDMSMKCADYAKKLSSDDAEIAEALTKKAEEFMALSKDIVTATDVWTDFYTHNQRGLLMEDKASWNKV